MVDGANCMSPSFLAHLENPNLWPANYLGGGVGGAVVVYLDIRILVGGAGGDTFRP